MIMTTKFDVIIIGAGSVGIPTAMAIATTGQKVCVIDKNSSPGQGENKHAIGGVRATHTSKGKILSCLKSIEIFSTWEKKYGESLEWIEGGYAFVAYDLDVENSLKSILPIQKKAGLDIDYHDADKMKDLIPGINPNGLRGGTFSPHDGSASPLVSCNAFFRQAKNNDVEFKFKEPIISMEVKSKHITQVNTSQNSYEADWIINAAGPGAKDIGKLIGLDLPLYTDSHEAGVTEPVQRFLKTMVVDMRKGPGTKNYYFYQDKHGGIVFCVTPEPAIIGTDTRETSLFLPQISKRMVDLLPRLKNLKVRRTWRGVYPMTTDGNPLVGSIKEIDNYINANGMCGQGFMLGPGIGELVKRIVIDKLSTDDNEILAELSLYRDFGKLEKLK